LVYPGIRSNKSVVRFGNKHATIHLDQASRLTQHDFDQAGIFPPLPGVVLGKGRRGNVSERYEAPFGL
jgi:hypothetical protein